MTKQISRKIKVLKRNQNIFRTDKIVLEKEESKPRKQFKKYDK